MQAATELASLKRQFRSLGAQAATTLASSAAQLATTERGLREQIARAENEALAVDRVAALVDGFETPFGLELLSTVHWVLAHEGASLDSVAHAVYRWGDRKRRFKERQIDLAASVLTSKGWLGGEANGTDR